MPLLIQLCMAIALVFWGILSMLVSWGPIGMRRFTFLSNVNYGAPNGPAMFIGVFFLGVGVAILANSLGWSPNPEAMPILMSVTALIFGVQLAIGRTRFENNLSLTLRKNPPPDDVGKYSRPLGWVIFFVALYALGSSLHLFGWNLSREMVSGIVVVCATFFISVLANLLTGSTPLPDGVKTWLPAGTGLIIFILILFQLPSSSNVIRDGISTVIIPSVTQQKSATPTPAKIEIVANKRVITIGEKVTLTAQVPNNFSAATYQWSADYGSVPADRVPTSSVTYTAPNYTTPDQIRVTVRDSNGNMAYGELNLQIVVSNSSN
ncbi:MAG: hypothetical protein EXR62_16600 [Chloroflexi bacterium]|nr:hypothetical protein [Chloroflexota bacterium]